MDGVLDNHYIGAVEQKLTDVMFKRVDSETIDKLIEKEDTLPSKLDDTQKESLKEVIERTIDKEKFTLQFENMSETDLPFMVMQNEFMRRMKDMSALGGQQAMFMGNMPENYSLVANSNNPVFTSILEETDGKKQDGMVKQLYDLARLSQNLLKGEELTAFVKRSVDLIKE